METEIKLTLPPAARPLVESHPLFADIDPRASHHLSTYYDTPDFALRQRGAALRVRRSGDHHVQTLKSQGGRGDFASRHEWEWTVPSDALDEEALTREGATARLVEDVLGRLEPVFVTEIERLARILVLDGKTIVEAVLDSGEVRAGDRRHAIEELELELKGGPVGPMLRLAADLAQRAGLRFCQETKSERGYGLLTDDPHPRADGPAVTDGTSLGEAFPLMIGAGCQDLAAELSGAARGEVEGIHRLRAAIRRLRSLLVLFAPCLDAAEAERFDALLGEFGRALSAGRDWDVFLTETLAGAEAELGAETLAPLREAASDRAREAHAAVTDVVEGPMPTALLLDLSLWTADVGWMRAGEATAHGTPLAEIVPDLLDRLERKALRRGRRLRSRGTEELHALRKSLKKLRYACEDVAALFDGRPVRRYLGAVKKVLRDLGRINDTAVTMDCIAMLGTPDHAALQEAGMALTAWTRDRRKAGERDLRRHWRRFRHAEPFWS